MSEPKPASELRISIALGTSMVIQAAVALIWAGSASERLHQLERRADNTGEVIERTARLEEQIFYLRATLERVDSRLEALAGEE